MLEKRAKKLKILRREEFGNSIYWQILNGVKSYNVSYNKYSDKWTCSCRAFVFNRLCSHILKAKEDEQKRKGIEGKEKLV